MPTPVEEVIRYDGSTMALNMRPLVQVEARRGRRWIWYGQKGWWVHLYLFHGWHIKRFVLTLAEANVFLKHDPDVLPWLEARLQPQEPLIVEHELPTVVPLWRAVPSLIN